MINSNEASQSDDSPRSGGDAEQARPKCRCTPEEIEHGHRHRCPAGPPTYRAVGRWAGLTTDEIEGQG